MYERMAQTGLLLVRMKGNASHVVLGQGMVIVGMCTVDAPFNPLQLVTAELLGTIFSSLQIFFPLGVCYYQGCIRPFIQ